VRLFLIALSLLLVIPQGAAAQDALDVASGGDVRDIGARDGRVVWIAGPTRDARLRTASGGAAFDVPVDPLPDGRVQLSVGTDAEGHVVAAYPRCAPALSGAPRECDAYLFTFTGPGEEGVETRLPYNLRNVSEFAAAVDGNYLVLGRRFAARTGDRARFEYLYVGRADGSTRLHRIPTGAQDANAEMPLGNVDLDLRRATFTWRGSARFDSLGARQTVIAPAYVAATARSGAGFYYSTLLAGEGGGTPSTALSRVSIIGEIAPDTAQDEFLTPFAVDRGRFYAPNDDSTRVQEVPAPRFR
jgi:hypothetical protein